MGRKEVLIPELSSVLMFMQSTAQRVIQNPRCRARRERKGKAIFVALQQFRKFKVCLFILGARMEVLCILMHKVLRLNVQCERTG